MNKGVEMADKKEITTCADIKKYLTEILSDIIDIRDIAEGNKSYMQNVLINAAIILLELRQNTWDYQAVKKQISKLAYELIDAINEK